MLCLKYPSNCFVSPSDNLAEWCRWQTGGGPARWQRMADRQQQGAGRRGLGPQGGRWSSQRRAQPAEGLHHPWHSRAGARRVSGAGHRQPSTRGVTTSALWEHATQLSPQGSCCTKRLLGRGRAGWSSQNSPDPGLLTSSREEQPPCPSWAPVLSLRKRNQPGVPCFGINKCPGHCVGVAQMFFCTFHINHGDMVLGGNTEHWTKFYLPLCSRRVSGSAPAYPISAFASPLPEGVVGKESGLLEV